MHKTALFFAAVAALISSVLVPLSAWAAPAPVSGTDGTVSTPARTQISFSGPFGVRIGSANEHESRTAMSIIKLFLAEHVVREGTPEDRDAAIEMIRASDDATADLLQAKYPEAIATTIAAFGLVDTYAPGYWGLATTSTYDMVTYLATKKRTDPRSPVLTAMASAYDVAADGYAQNFGTARLPGVVGTKWGWTNDRSSAHASASFGPDFVVAVSTYGSAEQLSADVTASFLPKAQDVLDAPDAQDVARSIRPLCAETMPTLCTVGIHGRFAG